MRVTANLLIQPQSRMRLKPLSRISLILVSHNLAVSLPALNHAKLSRIHAAHSPNAASKLILYLAADGYKTKTPLFTMHMRFLGEYMGLETHLVEGAHREVRLQASQLLRDYIGEKVHVEFDGVDNANSLIAEAIDENNGHVNTTMTEAISS
jgi:hypothetical protein